MGLFFDASVRQTSGSGGLGESWTGDGNLGVAEEKVTRAGAGVVGEGQWVGKLSVLISWLLVPTFASDSIPTHSGVKPQGLGCSKSGEGLKQQLLRGGNRRPHGRSRNPSCRKTEYCAQECALASEGAGRPAETFTGRLPCATCTALQRFTPRALGALGAGRAPSTASSQCSRLWRVRGRDWLAGLGPGRRLGRSPDRAPAAGSSRAPPPRARRPATAAPGCWSPHRTRTRWPRGRDRDPSCPKTFGAF